jgi:signal transduction histidine kinase
MKRRNKNLEVKKGENFEFNEREKKEEIEEIDLKKDESSDSNFEETESHEEEEIEEEEETTTKKKRKRREQPEILRRSKRDKKVVEDVSEETEEEIFEVEAILLHKKFKNRWYYLIKWSHYTMNNHNTWEPTQNLQGSENLLEEYKENGSPLTEALVIHFSQN